MSLSLRDQRAAIYTYSDAGSDGFTVSRYTFLVERWCRVETPSAREQTLAAKADERKDAVIAFADEVTVTVHDLIIVGAVQYKVTGVKPRRQQRELICECVLSNETLDVVES